MKPHPLRDRDFLEQRNLVENLWNQALGWKHTSVCLHTGEEKFQQGQKREKKKRWFGEKTMKKKTLEKNAIINTLKG